MAILNRGKIPTFDTIRGGKRYQSFVDITACSMNILDLIEDWRVEEGLTCSDHNGVVFHIKLEKSKGIGIIRTTRKYNSKKANWQEFNGKLNQLLRDKNITISEIANIDNIEEIEVTTQKITEILTIACKHSMPIKKSRETLTVPWWSEKLAEMKQEVARRKRRIRCAAPARRSKVVSEYLEKKAEYEAEATKAQIDSWKDFCGKQDREGMWEGIYRVIGRTSRREEDLPLGKMERFWTRRLC
ncbi:uncharacterized protein [Choristoneura fumiferana]|uniref:uncharacterized protein n=1 Tax=Choristoneura fumiferana TaxID=7141 RepID=UPI003D159CC9